MDDGEIKIAAPDLGQEEIETITFGASMLDFDAEIDARHQISKVSSYAWNYADQELLEIEANDPAVSLNGNLSASDLADTIGVENVELRHGRCGNGF